MAVILAIAAIAIAARIIPGERTIDDAYITFRYARNILAGSGFVFNPGEHVLGTTTPLYTLLLVLAGSVTGGAGANFPLLALALNAVFDALTCVFLYRIAKSLGYSVAGLFCAAAWAIAPFSVTFAIGGMETSFFILLLVSCLYFYLNSRYRMAFLLGGFAFLVRPDVLIFLALIGADRAWRAYSTGEIKSFLKEVGLLVLPVIPWLVFAWIYFGTPIPHSVIAKTVAYHISPDAALIRLLQHYATPFYDQGVLGVAGIALGMILYPSLAILGTLRLIRVNRKSWIIGAYPLAYFLVFAAANPLLFRWYLAPPLPAYFLVIFAGASAVLESTGQALGKALRRSDPRQRTGKIPQALMVLPLLFSLSGWTIHPDHGLTSPAPIMAWYQLELLYARAADLVAPALRPGDVIAAGDVGVLGYRTGAPILDTVGLNSPASSKYYPLPTEDYVINYAIPDRLILDSTPAFVIFPEVYGRRTLLASAEFLHRYQLWKKIDSDVYGSDGILIFRRKS